jgi:amphi-Trp domain-containing protein
MKTERTVSRWTLARRLHSIALHIAAGKPIVIGGVSVRVPDQVVLEEDVDKENGETEIEFEITWSAAIKRSARKSSRASSGPRKNG